MIRGLLSLVMLTLLVRPSSLNAQEGVLQQVREEVNSEKQADRQGSDTTGRRPHHEHCSDTGSESWWAILGLPFWGPYYGLGDNYSENTSRRPALPYADYSPLGPTWRTRLSLDNSTDFSGLNRLNGRLLFDTCTRFGVETEWLWLHERLGGRRTDDLVTGHVNLTFRFAQGEGAEFRAGLGARVLSDHGDTHLGFNFTYAGDFFPVKPFVISTLFDLGTVGAAGYFHGRITGGVTHGSWEFLGGFDYLRIGRVDMPAPVVGVRCWF